MVELPSSVFRNSSASLSISAYLQQAAQGLREMSAPIRSSGMGTDEYVELFNMI
jgi:hypothetical protein